MRRETRDELLLGFLAINAMLREETRSLRRALHEWKHNPNWRLQPRAPPGTATGGQWVGGSQAFAPISARDQHVDTNGIPTPGWTEPEWEYPAFPHTPDDGDVVEMSAEEELALEAVVNAFNLAEAFNYRRVMGRSAEDSYEMRLIAQGIPYIRSVYVTTREGVRIYDFMQLGPLGWEFVEVKANRAVATPRQQRIDAAVQIFGFSIDVGPLRGIQGPTNVRLMRTIPSDHP